MLFIYIQIFVYEAEIQIIGINLEYWWRMQRYVSGFIGTSCVPSF